MTLPAAVDTLVDRLVRVDGVVGVTLGGSRASGQLVEGSDTDLGIYHESWRLDQGALDAIAREHGGRLASPGSWGPWVDGGAWLIVDGQPVDLILRDVARVADQCERAAAGLFAFHTQPGHPLGFLDIAYAGEVALGIPLADPLGTLAQLRDVVTPYPPALRDAMVAALWQVDLLLDAATKGVRRGDAAYVALTLASAAMLIAHAWHAVAGVWVLNEKGLVPGVARLDVDTRGFADVAVTVCAAPGRTPDELAASIEALRAASRPTR